MRDRGVAWYPSGLGCPPPRFKSARSHAHLKEADIITGSYTGGGGNEPLYLGNFDGTASDTDM